MTTIPAKGLFIPAYGPFIPILVLHCTILKLYIIIHLFFNNSGSNNYVHINELVIYQYHIGLQSSQQNMCSHTQQDD